MIPKISQEQVGVHCRAELFYQKLDELLVLRNTLHGELLAERRKHQPVKILCSVIVIDKYRYEAGERVAIRAVCG